MDAALAEILEDESALTKATDLMHPSPLGMPSLVIGDFDYDIAAILQQLPMGLREPQGFFCRRLSATEIKDGVFGREVMATYGARRHFLPFTGHKSLLCALHRKSDHYCL